jgi:hypothetical protein
MSELDLISRAWPILISLLAFVAWNIRLESKVQYLERDQGNSLEREKAILAKIDAMQVMLSTLMQQIARLETRIEMINKHNQRGHSDD